MITITGGIYEEYCMHPYRYNVFGSGGRAASAIAAMGGKVKLTSYCSNDILEVVQYRAELEGFLLNIIDIPVNVRFHYTHALAEPLIYNITNNPPLEIKEENVIRFGFMEGTAIVDSKYAVYDPQNVSSVELFHANGSKAEHLAIVLNQYEARKLFQIDDSHELLKKIAVSQQAEVVILKKGPDGCLVYDHKLSEIEHVPAFSTRKVSKIGSGDNFVAHFGYAWMEQKKSAYEAALQASKATAYYCETEGFITPQWLETFSPHPINLSEQFKSGVKPKVYLAGPFFNLAQLWLIEEARRNLQDLGLDVFSPYHDVGKGNAEDVVEKDLEGIHKCDLLFAVADGMDSGTIYEIGYARAINKPVVIYAENESEENLKMMEGSNCKIHKDYVTAIYHTLWTAISQ
ncbi:nucleoside 2-deoxyribosyltransferase [Acinetobacter soli]|uniref:PfkB family carbohydrate kinase n=1 Tax=Acinetobacter soli TaxID=487316 RepID=UPI001C0D745F|nr:PfkB family carbohydrate kinase [Acinetobacter soli]MBU3119473.1 nucleoside 2-deoxyribosyltransferase [Acinetobacter soli]